MPISKIRKRDGSIVDFDEEKIVNAIFKAAESVGGSDRAEAEKVAKKAIEYLNSKFKEDFVPSVEDIQDIVEKALIDTGHAATAKSFILYRHRKTVERESKRVLGVKDDLKLPLNSIQVLERRYLLRDDKGKIIETPSQLFRRVANFIATNEAQYGADESAQKYFSDAIHEIMTSFEFLPNSPTLMNAGTGIGQLAACFVLPVPDDIEGIFDSVKNAAIIHKTGGGCIIKGSRVFSTFCGSEPIDKLYNYFDAGDNVQEENGAFYIDISNENLRVPSFDKINGSMDFKPVSRIWKYLLPTEKTFKIEAKGGYCAMTSEWHPFFVFENGSILEKRADELKPGDHIISSNPSLRDNWAYSKNHIIEDIEINDEFAWLIGLFCTDGSLDETKQGLRFRLFSSDKEIIERALDILEKITGTRYAISYDTRTKSTVMRIAVYDQKITNIIKELNRDVVGSKERTVRIPSKIFKSPLPVIGAFLAGVIDGDGHIQKSKPQVEISGASHEFAEDLSSLFSLFGIKSRYRKRIDGRNPNWTDMHEVSVSGHINIKRLSEFICKDIVLSRKRERLEKHVQKDHSSNPANITFDLLEQILNEAGVDTKSTDFWRKSITIGKKKFFLARFKEKGKINVTKLMDLFDELLDLDISNKSKQKILLLKNVLPNQLKIKSAKRNHGEEILEFYDFTVPDTQNYLAGNMGLSVIHNTGFCFSYIRPSGDFVRSTAGVASGPISFMSAFDNATNVIKQGGKRRGANMGVLHVWHPDIEEFITAKQTSGVLENFNVSVAVDDKFMEAVDKNEDYDLLNPRDGKPMRKINARSIFKLIAYSAWKSAEPGLLFIDTMNKTNPTPKYEIKATNPCGEVPMPDYESCNLGSINLVKFVEFDWSKTSWKKKINWDRLRYTIRLAVQFLDNVIDLNNYPIPRIREQTLHNRRMGLGIMGFAKMLTKMGVRYESKEGFEIGSEIMKFITDEAKKMSHELGRARGSFPGFKESIFADKFDAMRNATVTSIAPTGTISMIADSSSGIEPIFALSFIKTVMDGTKLYYSDSVFEHVLKVRGLYSPDLMQEVIDNGSIQDMENIPKEIRDVFIVSHDVSVEGHVKMQAAFQKYTDLAVSKTINMPAEASVDDVEQAYMLAWKQGCKGITIYREGSRGEGVLSMGKKKKQDNGEEKEKIEG
jgi:ribonucleoside-diphosphate reductase alpha chain